MSTGPPVPETPSTVTMQPIGVVRSPFSWRLDAPRQAAGSTAKGRVVLLPGFQNALQDLGGFDYCWILFWFCWSRGWNHQVVPPRDRRKRGLFATRSPDRPNPIGLSAVRIRRIVGTTIHIEGLDMLDGTPVLDIKPYIPAYDAMPTARAGWVEGLPPDAPDHRRDPRPGYRPRG